MSTAKKVPSYVVERPEIPQSTKNAVIAHIMRERQRKKEEIKEKEDAASLIIVKQEMHQLEQQIGSLRTEKEEFCASLKRVVEWNEDEGKEEEPDSTESHPPKRASLDVGAGCTGWTSNGYTGPIGALDFTSKAPSRLSPQAGSIAAKRPRSPSPPVAEVYRGVGVTGAYISGARNNTADWPDSLPLPTAGQEQAVDLRYHHEKRR